MQLDTQRLILKESPEKKVQFPQFTVLLKKGEIPIGKIGLHVEKLDGEEKLGISLFIDPKYQGKGFTTEAAFAICNFIFDDLKLTDLVFIINPKDKRGTLLAKRLGMFFWKKNELGNDIYALKKLSVESHCMEWHMAYQNELKKLKKVFKGIPIYFEHFGSTAIPSCDAKPIIDILGIVPDINQIDEFNESLAELQYEPFGEFGLIHHRFFQKKNENAINLHFYEASDPEIARNIRFREFLKKNPEKAKEYSLLKQDLVKKFPGDRFHYNLGKSSFIKKIDIQAAWKEQPVQVKKFPAKKNWSLDQIKNAIEVNKYLEMTYFAKYVEAVHWILQPDVTIIKSGYKALNSVFSTRFIAKNAKDRVKEVLEIFKTPSSPFAWWVRESDTPHDLSEILIENGLREHSEEYGMYLNLSEKDFAVSSKQIKRVNQADQMKDFVQILDAHPEVFLLIYSQIPPVIYTEGAPIELYVEYEDELPVQIGVLVLHANVAGIYSISNPEKGINMIQYLLKRSKKLGMHYATVQTNKKNRPFYNLLGFIQGSVIKEFSW